jgi:hypothetical protein
LHSTKWSNRKKKEWKPLSSNKKIQYRIQKRNEENGYPVPDPNKTVINVTRNPVKPIKTPSRKKSCKKSLRISWRRY